MDGNRVTTGNAGSSAQTALTAQLGAFSVFSCFSSLDKKKEVHVDGPVDSSTTYPRGKDSNRGVHRPLQVPARVEQSNDSPEKVASEPQMRNPPDDGPRTQVNPISIPPHVSKTPERTPVPLADIAAPRMDIIKHSTQPLAFKPPGVHAIVNEIVSTRNSNVSPPRMGQTSNVIDLTDENTTAVHVAKTMTRNTNYSEPSSPERHTIASPTANPNSDPTPSKSSVQDSGPNKYLTNQAIRSSALSQLSMYDLPTGFGKGMPAMDTAYDVVVEEDDDDFKAERPVYAKLKPPPRMTIARDIDQWMLSRVVNVYPLPMQFLSLPSVMEQLPKCEKFSINYYKRPDKTMAGILSMRFVKAEDSKAVKEKCKFGDNVTVTGCLSKDEQNDILTSLKQGASANTATDIGNVMQRQLVVAPLPKGTTSHELEPFFPDAEDIIVLRADVDTADKTDTTDSEPQQPPPPECYAYIQYATEETTVQTLRKMYDPLDPYKMKGSEFHVMSCHHEKQEKNPMHGILRADERLFHASSLKEKYKQLKKIMKKKNPTLPKELSDEVRQHYVKLQDDERSRKKSGMLLLDPRLSFLIPHIETEIWRPRARRDSEERNVNTSGAGKTLTQEDRESLAYKAIHGDTSLAHEDRESLAYKAIHGDTARSEGNLIQHGMQSLANKAVSVERERPRGRGKRAGDTIERGLYAPRSRFDPATPAAPTARPAAPAPPGLVPRVLAGASFPQPSTPQWGNAKNKLNQSQRQEKSGRAAAAVSQRLPTVEVIPPGQVNELAGYSRAMGRVREKAARPVTSAPWRPPAPDAGNAANSRASQQRPTRWTAAMPATTTSSASLARASPSLTELRRGPIMSPAAVGAQAAAPPRDAKLSGAETLLNKLSQLFEAGRTQESQMVTDRFDLITAGHAARDKMSASARGTPVAERIQSLARGGSTSGSRDVAAARREEYPADRQSVLLSHISKPPEDGERVLPPGWLRVQPPTRAPAATDSDETPAPHKAGSQFGIREMPSDAAKDTVQAQRPAGLGFDKQKATAHFEGPTATVLAPRPAGSGFGRARGIESEGPPAAVIAPRVAGSSVGRGRDIGAEALQVAVQARRLAGSGFGRGRAIESEVPPATMLGTRPAGSGFGRGSAIELQAPLKTARAQRPRRRYGRRLPVKSETPGETTGAARRAGPPHVSERVTQPHGAESEVGWDIDLVFDRGGPPRGRDVSGAPGDIRTESFKPAGEDELADDRRYRPELPNETGEHERRPRSRDHYVATAPSDEQRMIRLAESVEATRHSPAYDPACPTEEPYEREVPVARASKGRRRKRRHDFDEGATEREVGFVDRDVDDVYDNQGFPDNKRLDGYGRAVHAEAQDSVGMHPGHVHREAPGRARGVPPYARGTPPENRERLDGVYDWDPAPEAWSGPRSGYAARDPSPEGPDPSFARADPTNPENYGRSMELFRNVEGANSRASPAATPNPDPDSEDEMWAWVMKNRAKDGELDYVYEHEPTTDSEEEVWAWVMKNRPKEGELDYLYE